MNLTACITQPCEAAPFVQSHGCRVVRFDLKHDRRTLRFCRPCLVENTLDQCLANALATLIWCDRHRTEVWLKLLLLLYGEGAATLLSQVHPTMYLDGTDDTTSKLSKSAWEFGNDNVIVTEPPLQRPPVSDEACTWYDAPLCGWKRREVQQAHAQNVLSATALDDGPSHLVGSRHQRRCLPP
jgi:hypothetical protein